jgi:hypothetical protein
MDLETQIQLDQLAALDQLFDVSIDRTLVARPIVIDNVT